MDILIELGLPAGTLVLAVGLVRGARFLEKTTSDEALKYVASLLTTGSVANLGKLGATLAPLVFDRIFGKKALSIKFIFRSFLATTLFWLILLAVKHPNWQNVAGQILDKQLGFLLLAVLWYALDWISLVKARKLLTIMSQRYAVVSAAVFFVIDFVASCALIIIGFLVINCIWMNVARIPGVPPYFNPDYGIEDALYSLIDVITLNIFINEYLYAPSGDITLFDVIAPSTLLTSMWTLLLLISSIIAQLLAPIDHVRRFTAWWFRDVEKHPLTAIATVAAILIVIGMGAIDSGALTPPRWSSTEPGATTANGGCGSSGVGCWAGGELQRRDGDCRWRGRRRRLGRSAGTR